MNDPLTSLDAMIAMIEPGFRMIDGSLLKSLYLRAGKVAEAAAIEPGMRLIDLQLLRNLAREIGAIQTAEDFRTSQDPGKRLIDGTPWKALAQMESGIIAPRMAGGLDGADHDGGSQTAQEQSIRSSGQGNGQGR